MKKSDKTKKTTTKRIHILLEVFGIAVFVLLLVCAIYITDYSHADETALAAMEETADGHITVRDGFEERDDLIVFSPEEATAGLIFYPGGKVQSEAYAPLMQKLAERGILCVLVKMPFRLAVLKPDAAEGITELFPEIESWYIGGHSLGGAMAAYYVSEHSDDFQGLILCAAFSTKDLSESGLKILSIYGSEDEVMNRNSYTKYEANLGSFKELLISGGCHAYFGSYGEQRGDGEARISAEEQREWTAKAIADLMFPDS